jgi:hypothetical protein
MTMISPVTIEEFGDRHAAVVEIEFDGDEYFVTMEVGGVVDVLLKTAVLAKPVFYGQWDAVTRTIEAGEPNEICACSPPRALISEVEGICPDLVAALADERKRP